MTRAAPGAAIRRGPHQPPYGTALQERTRYIMEHRQVSAQLTLCLPLNALALADYGIIIVEMVGLNYWFMTVYLGITSTVYAWWGWSMAQAAANRRNALPSLLALSGFWAVLHGLTFVWTPITNVFADVVHFGSLISGVWAAYATWRVLRGGRTALARAH